MSEAPADESLCRVAEAYARRDWETCNQLLRDRFVQNPDDGRCLQWLGLVWHAQGAFAAARRALESASLLVPLWVPAQVALAEAYQRCGRRDDALTILRFLAERNDVPTNQLPRISAALGKLGEYALALDVCREASLREVDDDEACFGMAYFMQKLGYPTECVLPLLRRALALEPERPLYRLSVGVVCARTGLLDEAYELLCGVDPSRVTCASCLQTMARLFEQFGDATRHDAVLARALQMPRASAQGNAFEAAAVPRRPHRGESEAR
ncbi:MAG: hypothetical protein J0M17_19230 [Planctomycetes bacterium]|nr:hypothetical protein [Planctomycetota bacterium]